MLLSLVIPTYNERQNIAILIECATQALQRSLDHFEIIVVDDDSPDGTWQAVEELAADNAHVRVISCQGNKGRATAVVTGWQAARGKLLGVMDGDLQHPSEVLTVLSGEEKKCRESVCYERDHRSRDGSEASPTMRMGPSKSAYRRRLQTTASGVD